MVGNVVHYSAHSVQHCSTAVLNTTRCVRVCFTRVTSAHDLSSDETSLSDETALSDETSLLRSVILNDDANMVFQVK